MTMLDIYGEMPYSEALTSSITPKYDDGKAIYEGCMAMIDEAIANFKKNSLLRRSLCLMVTYGMAALLTNG